MGIKYKGLKSYMDLAKRQGILPEDVIRELVMGIKYKGLKSYMDLAKRQGILPEDAIRELVMSKYFTSCHSLGYLREFVKEEYPDLLEEYDSLVNIYLLLKGK